MMTHIFWRLHESPRMNLSPPPPLGALLASVLLKAHDLW